MPEGRKGGRKEREAGKDSVKDMYVLRRAAYPDSWICAPAQGGDVRYAVGGGR